MIVGNGLIASAFNSHFGTDHRIIVFASGVSNSRENRADVFVREREMLKETLHRNNKFVLYFSTCSVNDPELGDTPYVTHKKEMEEFVRSSKDYAIFRLPQVVGRTSNPNTLTNYLYTQIASGASFQVWRRAQRNLIDVDDVASIVNHLVRTSRAHRITTNIACPFSTYVPQLVEIFEKTLHKTANYTILDAGGAYTIESHLSNEIGKQIGIDFDELYLERLIRKYYGA